MIQNSNGRMNQKSMLICIVYMVMVFLAYIYPLLQQGTMWMIASLIGLVVCTLLIFSEMKIHVNFNMSLWILTLLPVFVHSYSIKVHEFSYSILWMLIILLMIIAQTETGWIKRTLTLLLALCALYAVSTVLINLGVTVGIEQIAALFRQKIYQGSIKTAGLTSHYSHNGMYIAVGCIISGAVLFGKNRISKINLLFFSIFMIALLLTQKRGPLLAVAIAVIATYFVSKQESLSNKIRRILIFCMIALIAFYILYMAFPVLFLVLDRFSSDNVLSNREYLWQFATDMFQKNKLFGAGWGAFSHQLHVVIDGTGLTNQNAHNIYLQLLAETGIFGTICFVIPMIYTLIKSIRILKNVNSIGLDSTPIFFSVSMQFFFIIYGFTGNPLYDKQMFIPYMLSISCYFSCSRYFYCYEKNNLNL